MRQEYKSELTSDRAVLRELWRRQERRVKGDERRCGTCDHSYLIFCQHSTAYLSYQLCS